MRNTCVALFIAFISVFGGAAVLSLLMIMVMHLLFSLSRWVEFTIYFICF